MLLEIDSALSRRSGLTLWKLEINNIQSSLAENSDTAFTILTKLKGMLLEQLKYAQSE